jgi:hypothetical protein
MAGPAIGGWAVGQPSSYRVEVNVLNQCQQVSIGVNEHGVVPPFKKMACRSDAKLNRAGVPTCN